MEDINRQVCLPLLFDKHEPLDLYALNVVQLRRLLRFLLKCSWEKSGKKIRPQWWPTNLPYRSFHTYMGDSEGQLQRLMVSAVERCYEHYNATNIIKYCRNMAMKSKDDLTFEENDDGTTSLFNKNGRAILKYMNGGDPSRKRVIASTRRLLPAATRPQTQPCEIFLCGNCGDSFDNESIVQRHELTCGKTAQETPESDDEIVDITEESRILASLNLEEVSVRTKKTRSPQKAPQPRRFKLINDYYKVDFSSPLGKVLLNTGNPEEFYNSFVKKTARSLSRTSTTIPFDQECASYSVTRPYKSSKLAAILKAPWSHTYCFNKAQRREQKRVLRTGLTRRARQLTKTCRPLTVTLQRLSKKEIATKRRGLNRRARELKKLCRHNLIVRMKRISKKEINVWTKHERSIPSHHPVVKIQKLDIGKAPKVSLVDSDDDVVIIEDEPPKLPVVPSALSITKVSSQPAAETAQKVPSVKAIEVTGTSGGKWLRKTLANGVVEWVKRATPSEAGKAQVSASWQKRVNVPLTAAAERSRRTQVTDNLQHSRVIETTASDQPRRSQVTGTLQQSRVTDLAAAAEWSRKTGAFQQSRKAEITNVDQSKSTAVSDHCRGSSDMAARLLSRSGLTVSVIPSNQADRMAQRTSNPATIRNNDQQNGVAQEECIDLCSSDDEPDSNYSNTSFPKNELRHWPNKVQRTENATANGGAWHIKDLLLRLLQDDVLGTVFLDLLSNSQKQCKGVSDSTSHSTDKIGSVPPFKERQVNIPKNKACSNESNQEVAMINKELKSLFTDERKELKKLGLDDMKHENFVQTRGIHKQKKRKWKTNLHSELHNLNLDEQKELRRLGLNLLTKSKCTLLTRLKALEILNSSD